MIDDWKNEAVQSHNLADTFPVGPGADLRGGYILARQLFAAQ